MMLRRLSYPTIRFRDDVHRLFDNVRAELDWPWPGLTQREFPALNVWENDDVLFVEAELPGMKMDDLEVLINGDELTINGDRSLAERDNVAYHQRERGTGRFSRTIRLPVEVNAETVKATLKNGVLTVSLPKAEAVLPKRIEVKN